MSAGVVSTRQSGEFGAPAESLVRLDVLLDRRGTFLRFLQRRVGDRALAEDLLQEALVKGVNRLKGVRNTEAVVGWFFQVLENAAIDHHRRTAASRRALRRVQWEQTEAVVEMAEAPAKTCRCVVQLKATLKPAYASALDRIELDEVAVKDFAQEQGISRQNAAVRAFRARDALRQKVLSQCGACADAGCVDCSCGA